MSPALDIVQEPKIGPLEASLAVGISRSLWYDYWKSHADLRDAAIEVTVPGRKRRHYVWPRAAIEAHIVSRLVGRVIDAPTWRRRAHELLLDLDLVPKGERSVCLQWLLGSALRRKP